MKDSKNQNYYIEELDERVEFFFWGIEEWLKTVADHFSGGFQEFVTYMKTNFSHLYHWCKDAINNMKSYFSSGSC